MENFCCCHLLYFTLQSSVGKKQAHSCIKVALDFVSPENIGECIRLTEEFRRLPQTHRANEDKLEVKKMSLHTLNQALDDLEQLGQSRKAEVQESPLETLQPCLALCQPLEDLPSSSSPCSDSHQTLDDVPPPIPTST
ncbi:unnamed protein product [Ilex paraguariensis]|uniref:Uncharacterized protein n=1 Tax=Ilex paraguariensis TaxID=185542 RepID=A0ABC8QUI6_9AQUA